MSGCSQLEQAETQQHIWLCDVTLGTNVVIFIFFKWLNDHQWNIYDIKSWYELHFRSVSSCQAFQWSLFLYCSQWIELCPRDVFVLQVWRPDFWHSYVSGDWLCNTNSELESWRLGCRKIDTSIFKISHFQLSFVQNEMRHFFAVNAVYSQLRQFLIPESDVGFCLQ